MKVSDLVEYQLGELGSQGEEPSVPQLSLQTCITQRRCKTFPASFLSVLFVFSHTLLILLQRFALLRFPYSDLRSLPRGLPFLVRYNTVISVPLEVQQNFPRANSASPDMTE